MISHICFNKTYMHGRTFTVCQHLHVVKSKAFHQPAKGGKLGFFCTISYSGKPSPKLINCMASPQVEGEFNECQLSPLIMKLL